VCLVSPLARHAVVITSDLRLLPSPPFCSWCGPLAEAEP
jgi:hypothetical protein